MLDYSPGSFESSPSSRPMLVGRRGRGRSLAPLLSLCLCFSQSFAVTPARAEGPPVASPGPAAPVAAKEAIKTEDEKAEPPSSKRGTAREADALEVERASALFAEGRKLARDGQYGEACDRFERSLAIADGAGTRFNLADCWEHIGRTASAQSLFTSVATQAHEDGQLEREQTARARAAALEPRISRLAIEVTGANAKLVVRRNLDVVDPATFGKPIPIDPGTYRIEATGAGPARWSKTVQVPATGSEVWVTIPTLEATSAAERAPSPQPAPAAAPESSEVSSESEPAPEPAPTRGETHRPVALSVGLAALGVGSLAAGTVFALKYRSSNDDAKAICPPNSPCTSDDIGRHQQLVDDAKAARAGAFIGFGVGGAALIGAAVSYFAFGFRDRETESGIRAQPLIGADGSVGLVTQGQF